MLRLAMIVTVAALAATAGARTAEAYDCRVPALINDTKKSVCAVPVLRRLDQEEGAGYGRLRATLGAPSRTALLSDRVNFLDTRRTCAADIRCLEATYRAQIRLYDALRFCVLGRGDQRACVVAAIAKHREELHRSL